MRCARTHNTQFLHKGSSEVKFEDESNINEFYFILDYFKATLKLSYLKYSEVFVILWNPTRFLKEIKSYPLSLAFPNECGGDHPSMDPLEFMGRQISHLGDDRSHSRLHVFPLDVGDDEGMEKTLWDLRNSTIRRGLMRGGLI